MDIVSKLPFQLCFFNMYGEKRECTYFSTELGAILEEEKVSCEIVENENVSFQFQSEDRQARFYLEAFDGIPDGYGICRDEEGELYRPPSDTKIPLFENQSEFDTLCVEKFIMRVVCRGCIYYGVLSVIPKQLDKNEWLIMKEELENDMKDLGRSAFQKQCHQEGMVYFTNEEWNCLLLIHDHHSKIITALQNILQQPKCEIETTYQTISNTQPIRIDAKSIRYQLQKGFMGKQMFRKKEISYNTTENRFLKILLGKWKKRFKVIQQKIKEFMEMPKGYLNKKMLAEHEKYISFILHIIEELEAAGWFKEIEGIPSQELSNGFFMDYHYGYLYQLEWHILSNSWKDIGMFMQTYTWKPSSQLYEMWCFLKLCHTFALNWNTTKRLEECFSLVNGIPELFMGCFMEYETNELQIKICYNQKIPQTNYESNYDTTPYYMLNSHVQPDIVIHIYHKNKKIYLGSIVLECKYRRVNSFWNGTTMSSREQIMAYWTGSKSNYYLGKYGELLDIRPVECVCVLTPQKIQEKKYEGKIQLMEMRPGEAKGISRVYDALEEKIKECEKRIYRISQM